MHDHHHLIQLGAAWEPPRPAAVEGGVIWTRRFGRPTGIGPGDRVLLVVTQPAVAADVAVNAIHLPPLIAGASRWEVEITPLLRVRNELCVTLALPAPNGRPAGRLSLPSALGGVMLEIVAVGSGGGGLGTP